jgi:hypothetical protein
MLAEHSCPECGGALRWDESDPHGFFADGTLVSPIELCEQCGRWWGLHPATKELAAVFDVEFPDG